MTNETPTEISAAPEVNLAAFRVLLVDNDSAHVFAMTESLERIGFTCVSATSGSEGAKLIENELFDIVVTDLVMSDVDGMKILELAKKKLPDAEVILVTGHASVPRAVEAMQQGAYNFLEKPITPKRLQAIARRAADSLLLKQQNRQLHHRLDERFGFENLIYASHSMKMVVERLKKIAPTDVGVLITGQTGTGKDVIAQAIHQNSPRRKKPFVAINTAAVAEHLVESELFGHVKGAFTDAIGDRVGKFEFANGGTLFLDEVGDMPMPTQIKLLRVLEERKITRVGDNKAIDVNVRVLAATNKDLEKEIEQGRFRSDLYYRLKIVSVHLDPLDKRRDDIIPLSDFLRRQANKRYEKSVTGFSPDLTRWLYHFHWSGNVRQLKNVIESMVVMDSDGVLDMDDLSPDLYNPEDSQPLAEVPVAHDSPPTFLIGKSLRDIEEWAIGEALKLTNGNREETANMLGISERNLYRKLKEYNLS
ncbi:MAG: sigma-54-dependent Fis family transcriptional regulator [Planctomycetaceae bacterium]|jgi:two-component system response regulator HydG|nr:sigma-54-dependent Fis family transcriptional regulator [Planctomycetaceae bacterium]